MAGECGHVCRLYVRRLLAGIVLPLLLLLLLLVILQIDLDRNSTLTNTEKRKAKTPNGRRIRDNISAPPTEERDSKLNNDFVAQPALVQEFPPPRVVVVCSCPGAPPCSA